MSVEMTPYHLNQLISSTSALGMDGAERRAPPAACAHGSGREPSHTNCACVHPKVRTPYIQHVRGEREGMRRAITPF